MILNASHIRGCFLFCIFLIGQVYGQAKIDAFSIKPSSFLDDLKSLKTTNPDQSLDEFVKNANEKLVKQGINYALGFDAQTCSKIEAAKTARKDPNQPLNLRTVLSSVGGDKTSIVLPEAKFRPENCFPCFMEVPIFEINQTAFVTSIMGANIKFLLPQNFVAHQIQLVDNNDLTKVLQSWKVPFLTTPLSVSDSGNILYVGFNEPELKDLTLLIFKEGTMLIGTKKELNPNKKASALKNFPAETTGTKVSYIQFKEDKTVQTIKYNLPCGS